MNKQFEIIPHTADKAIKAYGKNMRELFTNASVGMFSLMADISNYSPSVACNIKVNSSNSELLLHEWLSELLYTFEVEQILFVKFHLNDVSSTHAEGIAYGLPISSDIEWLGSAVKAVTHHDFYIREINNIIEAQIIFDV